VVHGSRLSRHGASQARVNALEALGRDDSADCLKPGYESKLTG